MAVSTSQSRSRRRRGLFGRMTDTAEEDSIARVIPPTIMEEESAQSGQAPANNPNQATAAVAKPSVEATSHKWQTVETLSRIPVLQCFVSTMTPIHAELKRENWLYLTGFVYIGCLMCALYRFVTLPFINIRLAQVCDKAINFCLDALINIFPFLTEPYEPVGGTLLSLSRLLHPSSQDGFIVRMTATAGLVVVRVQSYASRLVLQFFKFYSKISRKIFDVLNASYRLDETPIENLPYSVLCSLMSFFWRYPYNTVFAWVLQPTVVQPTVWLENAVFCLQTIVNGTYPYDPTRSTLFLRLATVAHCPASPTDSSGSVQGAGAAAGSPARVSPRGATQRARDEGKSKTPAESSKTPVKITTSTENKPSTSRSDQSAPQSSAATAAKVG